MKVGLIDVDSLNFPNLCLMKISAYHKQQGDSVFFYDAIFNNQADKVYMAKVFTASADFPYYINCKNVCKGGTGYFYPDGGNPLPEEIEHIMPDYSLYATNDTAYGFLSRGCPRNCPFCIVSTKEGRKSYQVADLCEWWAGQKNIELLDPNILACQDHEKLLSQLIKSKAYINFNAGIDCRFFTKENIKLINKIKVKEIHLAWDLMSESEQVLKGLNLYAGLAARKPHGYFASVYVLVNFNTTMEENLFRIYKLRELGYDPYIMIYEKETASKEIKDLQRWVNNKYVWKTCSRFEDYKK